MQKQTIQLSIPIQASKEKIWHVLLDDASYRQWAAAFHEGSYFETDWQEGSKALFKGPEGNGMSSRILRHIPNEFITIEHLGMIQDGVEMLEDNPWKGFLETYRLTDQENGVLLTIEQDMEEKYVAMFTNMWNKALQTIKELAEAQS